MSSLVWRPLKKYSLAYGKEIFHEYLPFQVRCMPDFGYFQVRCIIKLRYCQALYSL